MDFDTLLWTAFGGACVLAGLYVIFGVRHETAKVRGIVWLSLDSAFYGGKFGPRGSLYGMSAEDIANDLTLYCEDASGYSESDLVPHVQAWLQERRLNAMEVAA